MPSTQFTCRVWQALARCLRLLCKAQLISALKGALSEQLAVFGRHGDDDVVVDDFERDLIHHLRDHRVDLARHDRGAGLACGQADVADASLGTGGEQAQVVADLEL